MVEEVSMKNTKKEMLEIINTLQLQIKEKAKTKLDPEKIKKETKNIETLQKAEQAASSDLSTQIHNLKISINKELSALSDKIEAEAEKHENLNQAIKLKQDELNEIYGIEKQAANLAAIIEAQNYAKEKFEAEMAQNRENLTNELDENRIKQENNLSAIREKLETQISETKLKWEKEKKEYLEALAEEKAKTKNQRIRENEEYEYQMKRTQEIEKNKFSDEMDIIDKEIKQKKVDFEKFQQSKTIELDEREKRVAEQEQKMEQLQDKVDSFSGELEKAVNSSVKEAQKHITDHFKQEEALLVKGFEGEKNVLKTKITALESLTKDQGKQIEKLNNQQEKAYKQVQEIAGKAVAGATERPQNITVRTAENDKNS